MYDVLVIGGGLAGLTEAILLARQGFNVVVAEKKRYSFHKVCGEYVSNEVLPFLEKNGLSPDSLKPAKINRFLLVSQKGQRLNAALDLGGFGISRYHFDNFLYQSAQESGAHFLLGKQVNGFIEKENHSEFELSDGSKIEARLGLGAYGKRSKLDRQLNRKFFKKRSPWLAVKYHIKLPENFFPEDTIVLYNFRGGYCGLNKIEEDKYCLCYLSHRDNMRANEKIEKLEKTVLYKNQGLAEIFEHAEFLYQSPEVINEISFASKEASKDGLLMTGDAAGMIAPLCGNGMAMAIHSGIIASKEAADYLNGKQTRQQMQENYSRKWSALFKSRLTAGRILQHLFRSTMLAEAAVGVLKVSPGLTKKVIASTHGKEIAFQGSQNTS
jgi:flavin-dependent dehydrogenase